MSACPHEEILVDYEHPHGLIRGVAIRAMKASPKEHTRPFMALSNPRCKACGKAFQKQELEPRLQKGGDLYDERFLLSGDEMSQGFLALRRKTSTADDID